ncbi:exopolyphosphatase [Arsenophonus symbiont of Ornithomya chloropus]|uniref:Ppx/GppA phosphatase family protein n=1 Tax=Arsenophonus symbiont of Ornithomya chloropus TaxID=634121 RepID=UPI0032B2C89B
MLLKKHSVSKPIEIVVVDLGSNSFHMIIVRIINHTLQILTRIKKRIHLVNGLNKENKLSEKSMQHALECLALFAERLEGFPQENICIVGTHALREAININIFLERAHMVIPYPINIISEQEEARLIFMGVEYTQPKKGKKLVIDVGGGSTEFIIGENFKPLLMKSKKIGCINFSRQFFVDDTINKKNFERAYFSTRKIIKNIVHEYQKIGWDFVFGSSGTIKIIHEVLYHLGNLDGIINAKELIKLKKMILRYRNFTLSDLPGLPKEKSHMFLPGLAILCGIFDSFKIKELYLSKGALREGILYEMKKKINQHDAFQNTKLNLLEQYNIDREQIQRVSKTTELLYKQWANQNQKLANPHIKYILSWAVMLHEVGLNINHSGSHRHAAYILYNTNIPGFNKEEQLLLVILVRFYKKSLKFNLIPKLNLFKKKEYLPIIKLLRLAILLNNQRQSTTIPNSLRLHTSQNYWTLYFPDHYLKKNTLIFLDLEKEKKYWQEVPGWQLKIQKEVI